MNSGSIFCGPLLPEFANNGFVNLIASNHTSNVWLGSIFGIKLNGNLNGCPNLPAPGLNLPNSS